MKLEKFLEIIKGQIIVSCQALPNEPLYCEEMSLMPFMAKAAKQAGSPAIRTSSVRDIIEIKKATQLPVIGLIKKVYPNYKSYITPTMKEIDHLVKANSDVIALDCTLRKRGDNKTINDFIYDIKKKYPNIILMADISTFDEGLNAFECGVDMIGTTLSGYTDYSPKLETPDFELVKKLSKKLPVPVIAEGKIHTPEQAKKMFELGAYSVVVGGAITRPFEIATRFINSVKEF